MDIMEQAQLYFRAEKITGLIVAISAVAMLGLAAWLWWMQKDGFARGLAAVLLITGTAALVGGSMLSLRTDSQVQALSDSLEQSGVGALAVEGERMEKVVRNFGYYRWIFYAAIVVALALLVLMNTGPATGVAVGLLIFAALGITVDSYAEARAKTWLDAILEAG